MELHTARLRLRAWRDGDREPFARLNGDADVMQYFPALLTVEESNQLADRIQANIEQCGWGLWAVEVVGLASFAGFIGLAMISIIRSCQSATFSVGTCCTGSAIDGRFPWRFREWGRAES